jgi:enoyl-CoA hydratase
LITLRRPDKLNALTVEMLHDLAAAIESEAATSRGIVLTGQGRAFSAGDDLVATQDVTTESFGEVLTRFQEITRVILRAETPVVAALNGIAVGGAAEVTLVCDARIGWSGSDYLFPENNVGLTISNASTSLLPRLLGPRALPIVLDGRRISGTEAYGLGLLDYFVDSSVDVVPKALEVLDRWINRGLATRFHLKLMRPPVDEIERAIERENSIGMEAWVAGTGRAGIARFVGEQTEKARGHGS